MIVLLLVPVRGAARWRVGMSAGMDYNVYMADKQYMTDYRIVNYFGYTVGISGRYDFYDWLALRAELNMTQKNHRLTRYERSAMNYYYTNYYLQLPVTVNFSFGGDKVRGFANVGFYGGYWVASQLTGTDYNYFSNPATIIHLNEDGLIPKRDQRWDCGPTVGLGIEYKCHPHWALQWECHYYHSVLNSRKHYMRVRESAYNATLVLQMTAEYIF